MFILNQKASISRVFIRLVFALLITWPVLVIFLSGLYVFRLTHPACPASSQEDGDYEPVQLVTANGIPLRGWWRAPSNGMAVIVLGGHGATRDTMLPEIGFLAQQGFGVLTLDYRHCAGRAAALGMREIEELEAGLVYVKAQGGVQKIAVLGFSAGGVAAIQGAARHPEIEVLVAMGNYASLWEEIANSNAPTLSLEWQIERGVAGLLWLQTGIWPASVRPLDDLAQVGPRPVLLIHGELESANNQALAQLDAAGKTAELWIVPGAQHGKYSQAAPRDYRNRLVDFLTRQLP